MAKAPDYSEILKPLTQSFQRLGLAMELVAEAERSAKAGPEPVDETLDARASAVREGARIIAAIQRLDAEAL
jgi:hypothetical protein